MKIIYHHRTQMDDAQAVHITEMINAFESQGHKVSMISLVKTTPDLSVKKEGGLWAKIISKMPKFFYEFMELAYNIYGYHMLVTAGKKDSVDFIYERYSMFTFCGILAARRLKVPIILEVNAPLYKEKIKYDKLIFSLISKTIENWVCNNSYKTIVVTNALRNILKNQGVKDHQLTVMSNGIDPTQFNASIDGSSVRTMYSIDKNKIVVGVVGWFRDWHGLDFLIETCKEHDLYSKKNVHLFFVGDGPAVPNCKKLAKDLAVEEHCTFTGAINRLQIPRYIAAIDIALQPRVTEYACPMKIIEYFAMGKVVIAPSQPNISELISDGENGLLFRPEDKHDLFTKLKAVLDDSSLQTTLKNNAAESIDKMGLRWSTNAQRVVHLLTKS